MPKKCPPKKRREYNKEITKLLLEFLVLSVTLSGCMWVLDANKKEVRKAVLGAMTEQSEVYKTEEEECLDKYERGCVNPSTNYCVKLMRDCKEYLR